MQRDSKIYVAGHRGMVGSALVRHFRESGYRSLVLRSRDELDLTDQGVVDAFFADARPEVVVFAAAKVGGIRANATYPAEFFYQNSTMATNTIHSAWQHGVSRLLFLGSTCIYPRNSPHPIPEDALLTSPLEPTNEAYAIAKIAGLKMCQYYRAQYGVLFHSAMPTNLYGPGDSFHPENSHVLPALMRRFHEAKVAGAGSVTIWGSGTATRDFLHVDDLAAAILRLLQLEEPDDIVNIGSGQEVSILTVAKLIAETVGFTGRIETDCSLPDGTPRKVADITRICATGWEPSRSLRDELPTIYNLLLNDLSSESFRNE